MAAVIIFAFILPAVFMYALYKASGEEEKRTINITFNIDVKED